MSLRTHRVTDHSRRTPPLERVLFQLTQHWWLIVLCVGTLYVGLPWLAPVFMHSGWTGAGRAIYALYATQCHQLPQRSFFLFGPKLTYALPEIQTAWVATDDPQILRQFVGNAAMGWKVAWSDRMVALYTSAYVGALLCWPLRTRLRPLPVRIFILVALPMVLDGATHAISDYVGFAGDFRLTNGWLAVLTQNTLPPAYYAGDALGSFNSWMRLLTGILFGFGAAWLVISHLGRRFNHSAGAVGSGRSG